MSILVTGSTGFVGKSLVAALQKSNRQVKNVLRTNSNNLKNAVIIPGINQQTNFSEALIDISFVIH